MWRITLRKWRRIRLTAGRRRFGFTEKAPHERFQRGTRRLQLITALKVSQCLFPEAWARVRGFWWALNALWIYLLVQQRMAQGECLVVPLLNGVTGVAT